LRGTPAGRAVIDRHHIRYAIVNPTCTDAEGRAEQPPRAGRPLFVSTRLVVLRIDGR
jgi:hypothetical protein